MGDNRKPGDKCSYDSQCANQHCGRVGERANILECCEGDMRTSWRGMDLCIQRNGFACQYDEQCQSDFCLLSEVTSNVCADKLTPGDTCESNSQCQSDFCLKNVCADKFTPGDTCTYNSNCKNNACGRVRRPGSNAYTYECCASGQTKLDWFSEYCVLPGGSPCEHDAQCDSDQCENNRCVSLKGTGESCKIDKDCGNGLCGRVGMDGHRECCIKRSSVDDIDTYYNGQYCIQPRGSACTTSYQCEAGQACTKNTCSSLRK